MAKKKPTTTEYKPHAEFDLDIKTKSQSLELIAHLENLKFSAGWIILRQILTGNMAVLERAIVLKIDPVTGAVLTEEQTDELRFKRNYLEELVNKPDSLIDTFKKEDVVGIPTYDPYATESRQLRGNGAEYGAPMARTLITE